MVINFIYPKYSAVHVEIHSEEIMKIDQYFKDSKYPHAWQRKMVTSGLLNKEKEIISTVMLLLEYKEIKKQLYIIDEKVWVESLRVENLFGSFNTKATD